MSEIVHGHGHVVKETREQGSIPALFAVMDRGHAQDCRGLRAVLGEGKDPVAGTGYLTCSGIPLAGSLKCATVPGSFPTVVCMTRLIMTADEDPIRPFAVGNWSL
jgi:hypothetical protein